MTSFKKKQNKMELETSGLMVHIKDHGFLKLVFQKPVCVCVLGLMQNVLFVVGTGTGF